MHPELEQIALNVIDEIELISGKAPQPQLILLVHALIDRLAPLINAKYAPEPPPPAPEG